MKFKFVLAISCALLWALAVSVPAAAKPNYQTISLGCQASSAQEFTNVIVTNTTSSTLGKGTTIYWSLTYVKKSRNSKLSAALAPNASVQVGPADGNNFPCKAWYTIPLPSPNKPKGS